MDALPIKEENKKEYCSKNNGVMHACGHDVHSASLLGVAMILNRCKSEINGTVRLIFQPGEEKLPGGASLMIKEGVLESRWLSGPPPEFILGQHVFPELEVGKVGFRSGMYMASTDELYLTVKGKGGHAAMPSQYINPLIIASEILTQLNEPGGYSFVKFQEIEWSISEIIHRKIIRGKFYYKVVWSSCHGQNFVG